MKVTELIKELEMVLDEVGDVPVCIEMEDLYYTYNFEVLKRIEPLATYVTLSDTNYEIWKNKVI